MKYDLSRWMAFLLSGDLDKNFKLVHVLILREK